MDESIAQECKLLEFGVQRSEDEKKEQDVSDVTLIGVGNAALELQSPATGTTPSIAAVQAITSQHNEHVFAERCDRRWGIMGSLLAIWAFIGIVICVTNTHDWKADDRYFTKHCGYGVTIIQSASNGSLLCMCLPLYENAQLGNTSTTCTTKRAATNAYVVLVSIFFGPTGFAHLMANRNTQGITQCCVFALWCLVHIAVFCIVKDLRTAEKIHFALMLSLISWWVLDTLLFSIGGVYLDGGGLALASP